MSINSVIDLANKIGFEAIDAEVGVWIQTGAYHDEIHDYMRDGALDDLVTQRAIELGFKPPYSLAGPDDRPLF